MPFEELTKYSWGGEAILESRHGDITQAAGSVIDLFARYNRAGRLTAIALDPGAGRVDLQGRILGSASGDYETGGSRVPYAQGAVDIRAQQLDFTALNQRLNAGSVYGARSFQIKRGDLTIGDEVRAREVNISVDAGSLTVAGRIDASGVSVGSIRLSARDGLRLASNAVLDAHGTTLRVDSYGQIIDAPNRAIVEPRPARARCAWTARAHRPARRQRRPAPGRQAARHAELNAPRLNARGGDIDIEARGPLDIRGARSIAVNGVGRPQRHPRHRNHCRRQALSDHRPGLPDRLHDDSRAFITQALANASLVDGKLAGLRPYADALHLRPGIEIRSATPDGDLVVQGDLDLSRYRYASLNPHTPLTGVYGSGEVGNLVIRAGGDLQIHGSINDGFAPPRT